MFSAAAAAVVKVTRATMQLYIAALSLAVDYHLTSSDQWKMILVVSEIDLSFVHTEWVAVCVHYIAVPRGAMLRRIRCVRTFSLSGSELPA